MSEMNETTQEELEEIQRDLDADAFEMTDRGTRSKSTNIPDVNLRTVPDVPTETAKMEEIPLTPVSDPETPVKDYPALAKKYEQEQKLRFVVEKWTKDTLERAVHRIDLLRDWDQDITGYFTLLDPETRMRIFDEVYPENLVKRTERLDAFYHDAQQRIAAIPVEARTLSTQRGIVQELVKKEYLDIPEKDKQAFLATQRETLGILTGVLTDDMDIGIYLAGKVGSYTQDVEDAFRCVTDDNFYPDALLEHLNDIRYDATKWNTAVDLAKNLNLNEKDLLRLLDDYLGDSRVTVNIGGNMDVPKKKIDWTVDGVFTQNGMSLLVAPPKTGKSTLIFWLAYCIATGTEWLGRKVNRSKVFYITTQAHNQCFLLDADKFMRHHGTVEDGYFRAELGSPLKWSFFSELEKKLQDGFKFIILDMLIDCIQLQSTNDYAEVNSALKPLRRLAMKYNAHILCVHHSNKQGTGTNAALGSQAFRGVGDLNLWMTGEKKEPRYLTTENRIPDSHGGVTFDGVQLILRDDGSVIVGTRKELKEQQKKLLVLVEGLGRLVKRLVDQPGTPVCATELQETIGGSKEVRSNTYKTAQDLGIIVTTKEGTTKWCLLSESFASLVGADITKALLTFLASTTSAEDIQAVKGALETETTPK